MLELQATSAGAAPPKCIPPIADPELLGHERVRDRLAGAAGRLAVVVAPGGYGKTSQVARWAASETRPVVWFNAEPADNDVRLLLEVIIGALARVGAVDPGQLPEVGSDPVGITTHLLPTLRRALAGSPVPFVLVIDEAHELVGSESRDVVEALAASVPPAATVVFCGRTSWGTLLGRLRVEPGVVEIGPADLALSPADCETLVRRQGVELGEEELARLVEATEGWPVGVQLAALGLLADRPAATVSAPVDGHDQYLADYLSGQWVGELAVDDARFLEAVACLDWLSGPVCDHVLGATGSGAVLERLCRSRLLLIPLDRRHDAYRMHSLLAQHLRSELYRRAPVTWTEVNARASSWFEQHGDIDRAVSHALRAELVDRACRLIEQHGAQYLTSGRAMSVERWLSALSHEALTSRPRLAVMAASTALVQGRDAQLKQWLEFAGQALDAAPDQTAAFQVAALRALLGEGEYSSLLADAEAAVDGLELGPWHAVASMAFAALLYGAGRLEQAAAVLGKDAAEAEIAGARTTEANSLNLLGIIHSEWGDGARAAELGRQARGLLSAEPSLESVPTQMLVWAFNALLSARAGDLDEARHHLRRSRDQLSRWEETMLGFTVPTHLVLVRVSLLLNDRAGAQVLLDEAEQGLRRQPGLRHARAQLDELAVEVRAARHAVQPGSFALTTAELRVLHYLPTNLTLGEIARRLFVSRNTVKSQAVAIYRKLGAASRSEAVEAARAAGVLPRE